MSSLRGSSSSRRRLVVLALLLLLLVPAAIFLGPTALYVVRKALRPPDTLTVPRETSVMFTLDMDRLRGTKAWAGLMGYMKTVSNADDTFKSIQEGTGFNALTDFDTVVGAFPMLDAGTGGEFGVILHGRALKPERFEAWSRAELAKEKKELLSRDYKGHKLLWDSGQPLPIGTFYRDGTVLFGGNKWIEQMIDLEAEPARAPPDAVVPLLAKVKRDWVFWGAGLVPEYVREKIKADGNFPTAATMTAAYLSVDIETGLTVSGGALLASESDALQLVTQLKALEDMFRGAEQVQVAGLVPYIDAIKFDSKGLEVTVDIRLTQAQVEELLDRAKAFLSQPPKPIPSKLPPQSGAMPQLPFLAPNSIPGLGGGAPVQVPPPPQAQPSPSPPPPAGPR